MHDANCKRICGNDSYLRDMSPEQIKISDAGYADKFDDLYIGKGVEVPTLRELCEFVGSFHLNFRLGVEIKAVLKIFCKLPNQQ